MMAQIELGYQKQDNRALFATLEKPEWLHCSQAQNYMPLYEKYFNLTPKTAQTVMLKQTSTIDQLTLKDSDNIFQGIVRSGPEKETENETFIYFKYSPLLDPLKYLAGKYDMNDPTLMSLPQKQAAVAAAPMESNVPSHLNKIHDPNNLAYVDGFFSFLSSQLLHQHQVVHCLDFYGSFLALKHDFAYNVIDDLDYLTEVPFFQKNQGILYDLDLSQLSDDDEEVCSRRRKPKLVIGEDDMQLPTHSHLTLGDVDNITSLDQHLQNVNLHVDALPIDALPIDALPLPLHIDALPLPLHIDALHIESDSQKLIVEAEPDLEDDMSCSSRSSYTTVDEVDKDADMQDADMQDADDDMQDKDKDKDMKDKDGDMQDGDMQDGDMQDDESASEDDDDVVLAKIKTFPVHVIALECCESTLDDLLLNEADEFDDAQWGSLVMQILMTLIAFQTAFDFTHNDLHTNNIMYVMTDLPFLYYTYQGVHYKVPTFGRIYKIIDFGRAVYKFRGQQMCSDSYHLTEGDASSQYNFEPFYNPLKPRIEPNKSFDLTRLGCALFDFLVDDLKDVRNVSAGSPIKKIILDWVLDDKGRNILYKANGEERYPEFKLYKMIARTVHNHVPAAVLQLPYFSDFIVSKKKLGKKVMNLDQIPSYA